MESEFISIDALAIGFAYQGVETPQELLAHEAQLQAKKKEMIKSCQDKILSLQQQLALLMGEPTGPVKTKRMTSTGRKLSEAGRQRIREAQAARWNKKRAAAAQTGEFVPV